MSSGPEFAGAGSTFRTPLSSVLPAKPSGDIVAQGYKPLVTPVGLAHPVTHELSQSNGENYPASWGRWFRLISATSVSPTAETLMSGPGNKPLLVLDKVQKGRVAELLSDQTWLWARGFEGGGPQADLLRRVAHWLMKEPELEEENLSASVSDGSIVINRRTMAKTTDPVTLTFPSGKTLELPLERVTPGNWRVATKITDLGLYHITNGKLSTVTAAGPLNPREVSDMRATEDVLKLDALANGGGVHWLSDGLPQIRRVIPGQTSSGSNWIGLRRNGSYRVTSLTQQTLLPPWVALLLIVGSLLLAWRMEGR